MEENDDVVKKLHDVYKITSFVEEMLLNSVQSVEYDAETGETFDLSMSIQKFIDDWAHFSQILHTISKSEDEILEIPQITNEQRNLINDESEASEQSSCFSNRCLIL